MVYEHLSRCFILEDHLQGFHNYSRLLLFMGISIGRGASILLTMANGINGFHFIVVGEVFL
jgi:hypothetical protein